LWREIERVREGSNYSKAFLIIPDDLTVVQRTSLRNRGITVLKGTFDDFVHFLRKLFPKNLDWRQIVQRASGIVVPSDASFFNKDEVQALGSATSCGQPK